ncbi:flagellar basal body P-ring formation chaperone FlgA [Roseateles sp. GG27B]
MLKSGRYPCSSAARLFRRPLWVGLLALLVTVSPLQAQVPSGASGLAPELVAQVQQMIQAAARIGIPAQARVVVEIGQLDPRLRLAPCRQVQPYLPNGQQMWGRARVGLRCVDGPARWNVGLPVTIKVFARALVATDALPQGTVLTQDLLSAAEIDIAAERGTVFTDVNSLLGRILNQSVAAGEALRSSDLKLRQWFAAGDTVMVLASGPGYAVAGEGQAMSVGLEGQEREDQI